MTLTEITPIELKCGSCGCGCPAVFKSDNASYVIIGKKLDTKTQEQLKGRIADDEFVIEITQEMLEGALSS
jgi:hypothetical protein